MIDTNLRGAPELPLPPLPILLLNFLTAADKVILFFTCLEKVEEPEVVEVEEQDCL